MKAEPKLIKRLSPREFQVLQFLSDGLSYNEISSQLCISINGVRAHIKSIYRKLQVSNSVQAATIFWGELQKVK